jgi:hypothetical protein
MTEEEKAAAARDAEDGGTEGDPKTTDKTPAKGEDRPHRKANREAQRVREERNTLRTTLESIQADLQAQKEAREKAEKTAFDATRKAVAAKHKLPDELASRLVGTTEAELEADALKLAAIVPTAAAGAGGATSTTTTTSVANPAQTPPPLTKDEIKKMSQSQINERWDEIQKVLAKG